MKRMMALIVAAVTMLGFTNLSHATLTNVGDDGFGDALIYDSVNNVTWFDSVFFGSPNDAILFAPSLTVQLNGTGPVITGWSLPTITQLTALHNELGSNPALWSPFVCLGDMFCGAPTGSFESQTLFSGRYEREALNTGIISTGTSNSVTGNAIFEVSGNPVAAVPEPETYAMMLAGLGLLGFMARRRMQKEAAA